jgi:hypothetical protein
MATSNFNLGQSITNYVQRVAEQGSLTGSDSAELSAHLFDATDDLQRSGLTEEEAFTIACKRLGNEQLLDEEYGKVNASVKTNKIWVYLLLGFNLFYVVPVVGRILLSAFYYYVHNGLGASNAGIAVLTCMHLSICAGIMYLVKRKDSILKFIETRVQANATLISVVSCISFGAIYFLSFIRGFQRFGSVYLSNTFNSILVEDSYYLIFFAMAAAVFVLVFSIDNPNRITLKSLFEKPSTLFLVLTGVFVETLASFTRTMQYDMPLEAAAFGVIYLLFAFIIAYYNKQKPLVYLVRFALFGLIAESVTGASADFERGGTHYTIYFVSALVVGVLVGWFVGMKAGVKTELVEG